MRAPSARLDSESDADLSERRERDTEEVRRPCCSESNARSARVRADVTGLHERDVAGCRTPGAPSPARETARAMPVASRYGFVEPSPWASVTPDSEWTSRGDGVARRRARGGGF